MPPLNHVQGRLLLYYILGVPGYDPVQPQCFGLEGQWVGQGQVAGIGPQEGVWQATGGCTGSSRGVVEGAGGVVQGRCTGRPRPKRIKNPLRQDHRLWPASHEV